FIHIHSRSFKPVSPVWLVISGVFKGVLAKYFSNKTQETKSAHYFIMFLFCIGISVIPVECIREKYFCQIQCAKIFRLIRPNSPRNSRVNLALH
ncbi:hypothetical protein GFK27_23350, partial [Salmonella enterica subsp. enterica serovar Enteritidis]|nr:hypothetical protein [Salmonella enterica subsp. enterica serovar Enteritidis]